MSLSMIIVLTLPLAMVMQDAARHGDSMMSFVRLQKPTGGGSRRQECGYAALPCNEGGRPLLEGGA